LAGVRIVARLRIDPSQQEPDRDTSILALSRHISTAPWPLWGKKNPDFTESKWNVLHSAA